MTAYLEDIFVSEGPSCHAPHCDHTWDVHDLWAHRMEKSVAQRIVDGEDVEKVYASVNWFNSTTTSYTDALKAGDERLFGKKVAEIKPYGSLSMTVPKHSAKAFRLRSQLGSKAKRYGTSKDEL